MVILLTYRRSSVPMQNLKIRSAKYKRRTAIELLRTADPVYEGGQEVKGDSIRKLDKAGKRVVEGIVVDNRLSRAYAISQELPKIINRAKVRSKTECDMAIDDSAKVLKRALTHKGYGANDLLYDRCSIDGAQKVQVSTTIFWVENGVKYSVYVDTVRVKKVIRTESTKLLPEYFTKYLDSQWTKTSLDKDVQRMRPTENKKDAYWLTKQLEKRERTLDKNGFRHRYAKSTVSYDYMINSDDIRDFREKVRLARMTSGYNNLY